MPPLHPRDEDTLSKNIGLGLGIPLIAIIFAAVTFWFSRQKGSYTVARVPPGKEQQTAGHPAGLELEQGVAERKDAPAHDRSELGGEERKELGS